MPSRPRSAGIQPNTASRCDRSEVDRSRRPCLLGWRIMLDAYLPPPTWRVPFDTPYGTGQGWWCSWTTAAWRWTRTWSSGPSGLTRKNALFAGSDGGARHWAIAMTLIQTAKLNGVDPMAWLTDVLERIVSGRTKAHELPSLLPWIWTPDPERNSVTALAA